MLNFKKEENHIKYKIKDFEKKSKSFKKELLIDGTGVNISYQINFLSILSYKKLMNNFDKIYVVSGGGLAFFIFWTYFNNYYNYNTSKIYKTYKKSLVKSGLIPLISLLKFIKKEQNIADIKTMCSYYFSDNFRRMKVKDLPPQFYFYCYSETEKNIVLINSQNKYKELNVVDLITALVSLPMFNPITFNNEILKDATVNKSAYSIFLKNKILNYKKTNIFLLHSNMFKEYDKENYLSLRPHLYKKTNFLLLIDFLLWINLITTLIHHRINYAFKNIINEKKNLDLGESNED